MSVTAPRFKFSHTFQGAIWNTLVVPEKNLLIIEVRDEQNFKVRFSALDLNRNEFVWKDWELEESWWIGMTAANEKTLLFHTFIHKGNPDHKNLIAYDIFDQKIRWKVEEFSFFDWSESTVQGYNTKDDLIPAIINVETGVVTEQSWTTSSPQQHDDYVKPALYPEGSSHFETLKKFLQQEVQMPISMAVEYLEHEDWIITSFYVEEKGLANYLFVFDKNGGLLMKEKLGENLQGLGVGTFFMVSGCLFLVKNKSELRVYD